MTVAAIYYKWSKLLAAKRIYKSTIKLSIEEQRELLNDIDKIIDKDN